MEIFILIPPSEGKNNNGKFGHLKKLNPITGKLLDELNSYDGNLEKLYGVKDKALEKAKEINGKIRKSKTLPAIERYSGVVYRGIGYESIKNKKLFGERVYILSGLFGLINSKELIPNYKFKINFFNADKLWKKENKEFFKNYFIIDLLPQAHRTAVEYSNGIEVDFVILKNGKKIPAGHNGKFIKGRFVRWLIENDITSPDKFSEFNENDFKWDGGRFVKLK